MDWKRNVGLWVSLQKYQVRTAYAPVWNSIWTLLEFHCTVLTHWGRDKITNVFSWMKIYEFRLIFHWRLFLMVQSAISSIGSNNSLVSTRWRAFIRTNDGKFTDVYMRHSMSKYHRAGTRRKTGNCQDVQFVVTGGTGGRHRFVMTPTLISLVVLEFVRIQGLILLLWHGAKPSSKPMLGYCYLDP